jgi:hypothetical protein
VDRFRPLLRMSGGSGSAAESTFSSRSSNHSITIGAGWKIICKTDCRNQESLHETVFSSDSEVSEMDGFRGCTSLSRMESPSSVRVIGFFGFRGCRSVHEINCSSDSHIISINGFYGCTSLCHTEIPSSVEVIGFDGFFGCTSLNEITFLSNHYVRELNGFNECTSLCRVAVPLSVETLCVSVDAHHSVNLFFRRIVT